MDWYHITFGELVMYAVVGFFALLLLLTVVAAVTRALATLARAFANDWRSGGGESNRVRPSAQD
jgi:hypothetical protein